MQLTPSPKGTTGPTKQKVTQDIMRFVQRSHKFAHANAAIVNAFCSVYPAGGAAWPDDREAITNK